MRKMRLTGITIILVVLNFIWIFWFSQPLKINALTTDDQNAIAEHPGGLNIKDYFTIDSFSYTKDFPFTVNSAKIAGNDDVLVLTDGPGKDVKGSYGAIWGNSSKLNYMNINEEQTISAWLYFGPDHNSDELYNGHGMTLTLQNDDRKTKSIGMGLQGLGAYGYDKHYNRITLGSITNRTPPSVEDILNTAIKNSMSLEFDTQRSDVNASIEDPATTTNGRSGMPITIAETMILGSGNGTYSLNGYDTASTRSINIPSVFPTNTALGARGTYGHIALTYPGIIDSYYKYPITDYDNTKRWKGYEEAPSMFHIDSTPANLIDDQNLEGRSLLWHHLTFKWIPHDENKATIKYSFNDKDIDGKENFNTKGNFFQRIDKEITVDPRIFNSTDGKILWGFTGANGYTPGVASKMVVFESIPAMATGNVEATITNLDNGKTVTEADNYVPHGANLELDYKVEFVKGRDNWKDISGKIQLPKHVNYPANKGILATIEYEDGTKEYVYSALGENDETIGAPLKKPLGNINGNTNNVAHVKIYGVATNDSDQEYHVDEEPAVFTGSNAIASTNSPSFIIGTPKDWTLNLAGGTELEVPYQPDESVVSLPTTLSYSDNHAIGEKDEFSYTLKISGVDKAYQVTKNVDPATGKLDLNLVDIVGEDFWNIFTENSTHTVTVTATDRDNISSNSIDYTINVVPNRLLSLEVSPNLEFKTITNFSQDKILNRINDYDVIVNSLKNPWTLSVASSKLTDNDGDIFNGGLIYNNKKEIFDLDEGYVKILSDKNSYGPQAVPINVADLWKSDTGLLLQQIGNNQAGKYDGTVFWQVGDYMENL